MNAVLLRLSHIRIERFLFWCQCMLLGAAVVAYIYFTAMSVVHVVLRQELVVSIQDAESRISESEAEYLASATSLSKQTFEEMGLVELASITYVSVEADDEHLTRRP